MSDLPQPASYEQILSDMLSSYAAKTGISDFNVGSAISSFFEVVALSTARASGDLFQILKDYSVDRAQGDALKRLAAEYGVVPITAQPTTGFVNIIDSSFTKISTKVYAGLNPPNIGSITINVSDASLFPASGAIYIGRGTPNVEGPLPYAAPPVQTGGYWVITLSGPTAKFHNIGETVILAQGGTRNVPINAIVICPSIGSTTDLQYSVTQAAVVLDGETEVDNVPVAALTPGASGNIPIGAIKLFASPPFAGATVTNTLPFTTGKDNETDYQLRVRVKNALASTGLGTATAVKASLIGAQAPDEQAVIVNDSIQINTDGSATVFIDDGTGYEAKSAGVGLEPIVDSAVGGEQFFQLQTGGTQAPVAKAFLQTELAAPFDLVGGDTLAVVVGLTTYQHTFGTSDFRSPGGATAYEITSSINSDTLLGFEATTAGGGTYVVIRAKAETHDSIQTTIPTRTGGRNAATQMGFPSNQVETLRLYKNDVPLSKDGLVAAVFTQQQSLWSTTIANGDTLILSVDGTAPITYTIYDADFIATGLYGSVAAVNSLESWVQVFNAKLTGVTASIVGQQIELTSNLEESARAQVSISSASTLVIKGMFTSAIGLSAQGAVSDFTLDRNTAQFELAVPLVKGDKLSAGDINTEGFVKSSAISSGLIVFGADAHVWILIDAPGTIIPTGTVANSTLSVSKPSANVIRYTSPSINAFSNVLPGDYVIVWSEELPLTDRIEGRVHAATGNTLDILVTPAEYAAATLVSGAVLIQGFIVLRSPNAPQKFTVRSGTKTLDQLAQELQNQTEDLLFSISDEQYITVSTTTLDISGSVLIVTADTQGRAMNLPINVLDQSKTSLVAFYDSGDQEAQLPLFIHAPFSVGTSASPIDSYITSVTSSISLTGQEPNDLIAFLHPYGSSNDAQPYGEDIQITSIAGTAIGIAYPDYVNGRNLNVSKDIRRVRAGDRFFLASPLNFGHQDTAVVTLNNDPTSETFTIPLYRRAIVNTNYASNTTGFDAYDVDSGPTASFVSAFGPSFDFSNFKVLMQAKKVLKPSPSQTAILYRSAQWGSSGEAITVEYIYPGAANTPIGSSVLVGTTVDISINLASGAPIPSAIDATTQWNITVTPNTPSAGIDQVTYTYSGVGTAPALTLAGGEYVNISSQSGFYAANDGVFRVSTQLGFLPTANAFSVQVPTGTAVPQPSVPTGINGAITFYAASPTTAAQIQAYVSANLSQYLTATLVNDGGSGGGGTIVLSTYEDSGFTFENVQLLDGVNWILYSDLSAGAGSPQFVLKKPLALPTDVGYAFNAGDEIRLIPTTMDQVYRLLLVLAVTGFTTDGNINLVDRGKRLALATSILGSSGAIQVIGGTANEYSVPILGSGESLNNTQMVAAVDNVAGQGIESDQWFRLQASIAQDKITGFSSNTSITTTNGSPVAGQTTIQMLGRDSTQRYFGKPRYNIRAIGNTFRVEKQGSLVCISWNGIGSNPNIAPTAVSFNDVGGGTINVVALPGTSDAQYIVLTGSANFTGLSIGDFVTISGMANALNDGTFLVTGISSDGSTLQVTNPLARDQFSHGSFTFSGNSTIGDAFTIGATTLVAGTNFVIGGTAQITAANLAAVIGTLPLVSASVDITGLIITVTGTVPAQSTALSYAGTPVITVSGPAIAGDTFVSGNFTAMTGVSEGDTIILGAPFNILNQGQYRVIRQFNNSIWIENPNVVEEEVTLPYTAVNLGFDNTTSFKVNATNHTMYLNWNGIGTEPTLGNALMGDIVTFGTDFSPANQGSFVVVRSGAKRQQISNITTPTGLQFGVGGQYFTLNSAGNINRYYVWFNVNGLSINPAPFGLISLPVPILSGDSAAIVAAKTSIAIGAVNGGLDFTTSVSGSTVTVTTVGYIATTDPANVDIPAPFSIVVTQEGRRTFLEAVNPLAVNQSAVFVTGVLQDYRSQMQFFEYEATVPGDKFVVTSNLLGAANVGSYTILQVLDPDTAVVDGNLTNVFNVSMNGSESTVFVREGTMYSGYKRVALVSALPGSTTENELVFDTNAQYQKINGAAAVEMTSLGKLNFPTTLRNGLDSYRYNTGLIRQANRIIYGDPRDPITYPGVGAAGADLFIREPLAYRIQLSIDIRIQTGAPFVNVVQQVRSNVSSLINSNPVGQSIDFSSIVGAARSVPGVISVVISSPQYNVANDMIVLEPSQKAFIIDPSQDISVSQIGS